MFMCETCFKDRYPQGWFRPTSHGSCECCRKTSDCMDVKLDKTDGTYQLEMSVEGQPAKTMKGTLVELTEIFDNMCKPENTADLRARSTIQLWYVPYDTSKESVLRESYTYNPPPFLVCTREGIYLCKGEDLELVPAIGRNWFLNCNLIQNDSDTVHFIRRVVGNDACDYRAAEARVEHCLQELSKAQEDFRQVKLRAFQRGEHVSFLEIKDLGEYRQFMHQDRRERRANRTD